MNQIRLRNRHHLVIDAVLLGVATMFSFTLRFEGLDWLVVYGTSAFVYVATSLIARLLVFYRLGMYRRLWYLASVAEMERVLLAGLVAGGVSFALGAFVLPALRLAETRIPLSVLAMDVLFTLGVAGLPRFFARLASWHIQLKRSGDGSRVIIAGAGEAGQMVARELLGRPQLSLTPIGFVDDDRSKHGHRLMELPVLGSLQDLPQLLKDHAATEVIIAMPSAPGTAVRRVVRAALEAGVHARTVPGLYDILSGQVEISQFREVQIHDLLRRAPIETDLDAVGTLVTGRTVMVTGAGGSIGSELCRQLAQLYPRKLILLGHGENPIFEVLHELRRSHPSLRLTPIIADVRNRARIDKIFAELRPQVVFHAAAHKHVPLMEQNVVEALSNNVIGTRNVVDAASRSGVRHFVLISTDKAIRPTSVMGASKRVAEELVQLEAQATGLAFVSVRFGNVLGSRGSVVPTFLEQIRAGGPVTVTHPDMCRFFMTIPEAVQLVLQAGTLGRGGEVFVLDMGEPVKIVDLARDLIRLSGLKEGEDIEVAFTGRRPGEKLFEEIFSSSEQVDRTEHPKVLIARNVDLVDDIWLRIERLVRATESGATDAHLLTLLRTLVPEFQPDQPAAWATMRQEQAAIEVADRRATRRADVRHNETYVGTADGVRPPAPPTQASA